MIKWGRRKKKLPSSPRPRQSLLSSWFLRLKKIAGGNGARGDSKPDPVKADVAPCCRSTSRNPHYSSSTAHYEEFYGGDEVYWRMSFRKGKICGYETEEEGDDKGKGMNSFSEMVSGIRRMKELKARDFKSPTPVPRKKKLIPSSSSSSPRKRSFYVHRGSPKRRLKHRICRVRAVISPRVSSVRSDVTKNVNVGFDSFAVVKCSLDPHRDFLESMLDMILDTNIFGAQQLEDLLACYLALNSDEYHHLIIKVFRQIWLALSQTSYYQQ